MGPDRPWNVPVRVEEVPETGLGMHLCADNDMREKIARIADVLALPRLEADFMITHRGRGLRVVGEVSATVEQTCVISLDPIENHITEPVDLIFEPAPDSDFPGLARGEPEGEPSELLQGGCVDLWGDRNRVPASRHRPLSAQAGRDVCAACGRRRDGRAVRSARRSEGKAKRGRPMTVKALATHPT